jgi:hypothetical protein
MAINDLHAVYPNRNHELRSVAKQCFEFGKTIAREPSAAHSNGLDEHAIRRQESYIASAKAKIAALNARPIPDDPENHPTQMPIDLSEQYIYFTQDINGNQVPLNESTQMLAEKWLMLASSMAKCQSASLAGSLTSFDHDRAMNKVEVIEKFLEEIKQTPILDLPETSAPASDYGVRSGGGNVAGR